MDAPDAPKRPGKRQGHQSDFRHVLRQRMRIRGATENAVLVVQADGAIYKSVCLSTVLRPNAGAIYVWPDGTLLLKIAYLLHKLEWLGHWKDIERMTFTPIHLSKLQNFAKYTKTTPFLRVSLHKVRKKGDTYYGSQFFRYPK